MAARLTIALSPDVLKLLKTQKAVTLTLGAGISSAAVPARASRPGRRPSSQPRPRTVAKGPRPGSHPAKLLTWAAGRKRPFGVADVMKAVKVKRAHASMILTKLIAAQALRREGRGSYRLA